jgi:hypothetical protein
MRIDGRCQNVAELTGSATIAYKKLCPNTVSASIPATTMFKNTLSMCILYIYEKECYVSKQHFPQDEKTTSDVYAVTYLTQKKVLCLKT